MNKHSLTPLNLLFARLMEARQMPDDKSLFYWQFEESDDRFKGRIACGTGILP
jgi:hypothetical protein